MIESYRERRKRKTNVAPSCLTVGLMQTGGTERYCQMYSSGRPKSGCSPSSSQSYIYTRKQRSSALVFPNPASPFSRQGNLQTNLRRDPLEQLQHPQRIQILLRLPHMRPQLLVLPDRAPKRLDKLLPLRLRLLRPVLFVHDLERADLLDGTVGSATVRAVDDLPAGGVDGFGGGLAGEVLEVGGTEAAEVGSAVGFVEEDVGAGLKYEGSGRGKGEGEEGKREGRGYSDKSEKQRKSMSMCRWRQRRLSRFGPCKYLGAW
jgi:hypothetical protein